MITSLYQSLCNMEPTLQTVWLCAWYDEEKQGVAEVHYAQYAQDLRRFVAFLRAEYGDVRGKRVAILAATATSMSSACTARSLPERGCAAEPWQGLGCHLL